MARRRKGNPVHGWVNFDKPLGMTSTQAVGKVRWLFDAQKAGHAGTLDPLATGILPIALGEATKTVPFMVDASKQYEVDILWGARTDTLDAEGDVVARSDIRPDATDITNALPSFIGDIEQTPPAFSAIKIDGKRAYDLARAGAAPKMKPRTVHIDAIEMTDSQVNSATFRVHCQKGTYIRSLARDLAWALGTEGHVTRLRRTQVGPFVAPHAFTLDALEELRHKGGVSNALLAIATALDDIPALAVTADEKRDLKQGRAIDLTADRWARPGAAPTPSHRDDCAVPLVLASLEGQAIALCEMRQGRLYPKRVFNM